ncbi:MAG: hypothetical protein M0Z30_15835 [Actinomycetota bacterium]|nr:hypothetical protein [Actinomycetota bacterium]
MTAPVRAFLAFTEVEAGRHADFNEWHQLDHRPANLALPGVIWGERWVRTPGCAAISTGSDQVLTACHYVTIYWFREPFDRNFVEWLDLGSMSYQWGRRPELPYVRSRPMGQVLVPLQGYANPRATVGADVLPLRPNRGVHITVSQVEGDLLDVGASFEAYDRARVPEILAVPGVAGHWTLVDDGGIGVSTRRGSNVPSCMRVGVTFIDGDVLAASSGIAALGPSYGDCETVRFSSPLEAIIPWQWDWFDGS